MFKGDISRKTSFFKCDDFSAKNSLDSILADLEAIDVEKENLAINKGILKSHNLWTDPKEELLGKRMQESEALDLNPSNYQNMRLAEKFTKSEEFFEME